MAPLRVLISGGGVAGPALAYWLSKLGHEVTLVERFPTLRASGQQIDLRGHGIQSMKRMGLEDAWRAKSVAESGIQFVDSAGRRKGFFPVNKSSHGLQGFTTDWEIMRGDLCTLLYDQTRDSVKYRFGVTVESMAQGLGKDKTVRVSFTDGSKDTFDLVVGADGQGSRMRSMILPPGTNPYRSLHMFLAYFTISKQPGTEYISTAYLAPNKRLLFTRRHSPDSIQGYMGYANDSEKLQGVMRGTNVESQKKMWADIFKDAGWESPKFVKSMLDNELSEDFYTHEVAQVRLDKWSSGRVVLLGDAAYCPSPVTGMGTSSSIVGAYVLAGEIAKYTNPKTRAGGDDPVVTALENYEKTLRPLITQVQDHTSGFWVPSSAWGIAVFNFLIGIAAWLRLDVLGKYILREDVSWTLPEYDELKQLKLAKDTSQ